MGSLDVTMNAHGVAVERRYGRADPRQLPRGVLDRRPRRRRARRARGGRRPRRARAARARGGRLGRDRPDVVAALPRRRRRRASGRAEPVFVRPPRKLLALGALAFACLLIEGASADWSAVYLRDELGTTAAIAAIGFTAFSVTMTARADLRRPPGRPLRPGGRRARRRQHRRGRLRPGPPRRARRWPRSPASRAWAPGCRASCRSSSAPSGHVPGMPAGVGLAAVSSTGYLGFLVGPPTIGGLAELVGPAGRARRDRRCSPLAVALLRSHHPLRARRLGRGARAADGGGMTTILSDLDGVLVDSHASIMRAWRWWGADARGRGRGDRGRRSTAARRARSSPRWRPDLDAAAESRAIDLRQADDVDGVIALPGAARALRRRRARSRSSPRAPCRWPPRACAPSGWPCRRCWSRPSACRAASPIPRATCSPRASSAPRPRTASSSRTRRPASQAGRAAGMHVVGITTTHDPAELDAHELAPSIAAWLASRRDGAPR